MPREQPNRTDEWTTPQEIVDLVLAQFGRIDLDPCSHPESAASKAAAQCFDIRAGQDGLATPWPTGSKAFVNPPYRRGQIKLWATKCAEHARAGGEALMLIPAATGSRYWRSEIWPHAAKVCFVGRIRFSKDGVGELAESLTESAIVYFGAHPDAFTNVWSARGTVVRVDTLQGAAGKVQQPELVADTAPLAERASGLLRDLVVAAKARHVALYNQIVPLRAAVNAATAEHGQYSLAVMEAERAVSLTLQASIKAVHEASRIEGAVQAFERALNPVRVPVALPYREREAAKKAARNSARVARAEMIARHRDAQEAAEQAQQEAA